MMELSQYLTLAEAMGFVSAPLDAAALRPRQEVRDMCAGGRCGKYDRCWSCPPGCGSLALCAGRIAEHTGGLLVQTVGTLEDAFDGEGMLALEAAHKDRFQRLCDRLREDRPGLLALGAGCCTRCAVCTYPSRPCPFPDRQISSMEAYGLLVSEVCQASGVPYYYGPCTIAYTSCILL